jgi:hypothetical protein
MSGLASMITSHRDEIVLRLQLGRAHWDDLVEAIERAERDSKCYNEQVWTFVLACSYAIDPEGPSKLAFHLTEKNITADRIWFEVKPQSPRIREGQTVLDLALGDIMLRKDTASGIELAAEVKGNIVFCEFKWYSDIDNRVSYDLHRNQLARVIENALLFRSANGRLAEQVHVCLVTPKIFRDSQVFSRLYQYKYNDYSHPGYESLVADLRDCGLKYEQVLPDISSRLSALKLSWLSYEQIALLAPASPIRDAAKRFHDVCKGSALG